MADRADRAVWDPLCPAPTAPPTPHAAQFEHSQSRGACLQLYFELGPVNPSKTQPKCGQSFKKIDKSGKKLAKKDTERKAMDKKRP